ncbi:MAG: hypothetical protein WBE58_02180, partial [Verrucomicrobiales bacterium]
MKRLSLCLLVLACAITALPVVHAGDPPPSVPLWAGGAPGSESRAGEAEKVEADDKGKCNVTNVHQPSVTPFL